MGCEDEEVRGSLGCRADCLEVSDNLEEIGSEGIEGEAGDLDPEKISNAREEELAYVGKSVLFEEAPVGQCWRKVGVV